MKGPGSDEGRNPNACPSPGRSAHPQSTVDAFPLSLTPAMRALPLPPPPPLVLDQKHASRELGAAPPRMPGTVDPPFARRGRGAGALAERVTSSPGSSSGGANLPAGGGHIAQTASVCAPIGARAGRERSEKRRGVPGSLATMPCHRPCLSELARGLASRPCQESTSSTPLTPPRWPRWSQVTLDLPRPPTLHDGDGLTTHGRQSKHIRKWQSHSPDPPQWSRRSQDAPIPDP